MVSDQMHGHHLQFLISSLMFIICIIALPQFMMVNASPQSSSASSYKIFSQAEDVYERWLSPNLVKNPSFEIGKDSVQTPAENWGSMSENHAEYWNYGRVLSDRLNESSGYSLKIKRVSLLMSLVSITT